MSQGNWWNYYMDPQLKDWQLRFIKWLKEENFENLPLVKLLKKRERKTYLSQHRIEFMGVDLGVAAVRKGTILYPNIAEMTSWETGIGFEE